MLALIGAISRRGDAFKPGYLKLLAYGGAARPEQMLREAGVDIADPDFWQGGFDVIAGMIDELEAM